MKESQPKESQSSFGELFRRVRLEAGKSLDAVGQHLGYTRGYMSDVELNRRAPLTQRKIIEAAEFFGVDPNPLLTSAARQRGAFVIDVAGFSDSDLDFLNELASLPGLHREQTYKRLGKVLKNQRKRSLKMLAEHPEQTVLDPMFLGSSGPRGMKAERRYSHIGLEREAQKVRAALRYDRTSPIELSDLFSRIQASRVKVDRILYEIVVNRYELPDGVDGKSMFDPVRRLFRILLSPLTYWFLQQNNPRGKWTLVHEFSHIWLHHRLLEKLTQLRLRATSGNRVAQTRLDEVNWRGHHVRWDCEHQADGLTAAFFMPAEGIKLLEEATDEHLPLVLKIQRRFGVSEKSASNRLSNYGKDKAALLTDTIRYHSSTHITVLATNDENLLGTPDMT